MASKEQAIDNKLVKRHYPISNMDDQLVFAFESDPNLCLVKNKIAIHLMIELPDSYIPENGFAAKQFSQLAVEVNSQRVSNNKTKGEYFLSDWLAKIGNFDNQCFQSMFAGLEGYFDLYNYEEGSQKDKDLIKDFRRQGIKKVGSNYVYEFIITPNDSFLNDNKVLPPGVELKLMFDRLSADFSTCKIGQTDPLAGKVLELKDVYAQVEYISSPALRNYHERINTMPISFEYDEMNVMCKILPQGENYIRLENIKGGNTPDFLFMGVVPTAALNGSTSLSPIKFGSYGIKEVNITLNGNSCNGYPIRNHNDFPIWSYYKFLDVIGRLQNANNGQQLTIDEFKRSMIIAHKFEGEDSLQGWLGATIALSDPLGFKTSHTLGMIFVISEFCSKLF